MRSMVNYNCFKILTVQNLFRLIPLVDVKKLVDVPVLVGSGVTLSNVHKYKGADGFIIGSHFKQNGKYVSTEQLLRQNI